MEPLTAATLVDLEQVGETRFRSRHNQDNYNGAIFGGQAIAQALLAAQRTVPQWGAHNCSGLFLRGGDIHTPVDFEVEITRDGRRYASRRVEASQNGKVIFDLLASFHDPEPGFAHQVDLDRAVPAPETLPTLREFADANRHRLPAHNAVLYGREFPVELRLIDAERYFFGPAERAARALWMRMPSAAALTSDHEHRSALAFISDYFLAGAAGMPHRSPSAEGRIAVASLNHSMWFHRPARADEWLLYRIESPWAGHGRGLAYGAFYDRAGVLVASVVQEMSMRGG